MAVDHQMTEKRLDLTLSHLLRMSRVKETNELQNPFDVSFFCPNGIMMVPKDFTDLIHQFCRFRSRFPLDLSALVWHKPAVVSV